MNKKIQVRIDHDNLVLIISGKQYIFPFSKVSSRLQKATVAQRENFTVSPSGYGIHWQDIDEDISIPALIKASKEKPLRKTTSKVRA